MIDYEKRFIELTKGVSRCIPDLSEEFPNATGFEKAVIAMRQKGWTYGEIQKALGMPSKKNIREALLKWSPDLIDNSKKKNITVSNIEAELYNILCHINKEDFVIEDESWKFFIKDKKVTYVDSWGDEGLFKDFDTSTQSQLLNQIKEQIYEES